MLQTLIAFIKNPKFFPNLIMFLYACTSTRYFAAKDVGHGVYWIAAGLITYSVTYLIKH